MTSTLSQVWEALGEFKEDWGWVGEGEGFQAENWVPKGKRGNKEVGQGPLRRVLHQFCEVWRETGEREGNKGHSFRLFFLLSDGRNHLNQFKPTHFGQILLTDTRTALEHFKMSDADPR